jgi:hypothetical protein
VIRVLTWLGVTAACVALWWLAAWGAHAGLVRLDHTFTAAANGLARDPSVYRWLHPGLDVLFELLQATVAVLWILGTLALLVGMAWTWRTGMERRVWLSGRRRLGFG